jgi:hypothetical protein
MGAAFATVNIRYQSATYMKKIVNKLVTFGKREWFLLIMVAAITVVIVLFESL